MTCKTQLGDTWDIVAFRELGSCRWTEKLINLNRQSHIIINSLYALIAK